MLQTITEPARSLPVEGEYDVAVVGGGIAGVAAAVAAARNGATVALLEKEGALGGLATLGNVVEYLPLCDGRGRQVVAGLAEELLHLAMSDGAAQIPACWQPGGSEEERARTRYQGTFHPFSFLLELEALVVRAGIDLFYDTRCCEVVKQGDRIQALCLENKGGRWALLCRTVVDASGEADVCARAGEETVSHRTNVAAGWFHYVRGNEVFLQPMTRPFAADPAFLPEGVRGYAGDDGRDVTAQILESRQMIRERLLELRQQSPGVPVYPVFLPTIATFRMARRLKGALELRGEDEGRSFADTVGLTGSWRRRGPVYALPFRCLTAVRTENLITAGRCISAAGEGWDVARALAPCAVTGEAAGTAAALAARQAAGRFQDLEVGALQEQLRRQGVLLECRC